MVIDHALHQGAVDTLCAALDEIDVGIVLLDKDLRTQFINRAFMRMWHLTDETAVAQRDFEGHEVAERLRQLVEARDLSVASRAISATISIGVAQANPYMESLFDLIKLADQALYAAKNAGRNRVWAA